MADPTTKPAYRELFGQFADTVGDYFNELSQELGTAYSTAAEAVTEDGVPFVVDMLSGVGELLVETGEKLLDIASNLIDDELDAEAAEGSTDEDSSDDEPGTVFLDANDS